MMHIPAQETAQIRPLDAADAACYRALIQQLATEGPFLVRLPNERLPSHEEVRGILQREQYGGGRTLVAERLGELIGYCSLTRSPWRRRAHVAHLVIGVRAPWQGCGIGGALLDTAVIWAQTVRLRRIELTVTATNHRAQALYRRRGFVEEGRKQGSVCDDAGDLDELLMAKLLTDPI